MLGFMPISPLLGYFAAFYIIDLYKLPASAVYNSKPGNLSRFSLKNPPGF
jgi:hypothetical protein